MAEMNTMNVMNGMDREKEVESRNRWETCVMDGDFEIHTSYPHPVRRKKDQKLMRESISNMGYVQLSMHGTKNKHRVVAMQWVDGYAIGLQVDHIDKCRTNNHISNLRWISASQNGKNKVGRGGLTYEYLDHLDDDAEAVTTYGKHRMTEGEYLFLPKSNRFCIRITDGLWRLLVEHEYKVKGGSERFVDMVDSDGKQCRVVYKKWRRLVL